jgi:prephenate dehydrogenase
MSFNKIVIFGIGLIGGSLALSLKEAKAVQHVVGFGRSQANLNLALKLGVIDEIGLDLASALNNADLVFLATPVAQTPQILKSIIPYLQEKTIITDAGSTKSDILNYVEQAASTSHESLQLLTQFVGGHPIAGAEKTGVEAASPSLFKNKNVILTPSQQSAEHATSTVKKLWEITGAKVTQMDTDTHDKIFAAVSHLPHLLAFALVDELASRSNAQQLFQFAASGFRDFTRIAGSSPEMWRDISLANNQALLDEISAFEKELAQLKLFLQKQDAKALQTLFERASLARNQWEKSREQ